MSLGNIKLGESSQEQDSPIDEKTAPFKSIDDVVDDIVDDIVEELGGQLDQDGNTERVAISEVKHGGKREGAGRKPKKTPSTVLPKYIDVEHPAVASAITAENTDVWRAGFDEAQKIVQNQIGNPSSEVQSLLTSPLKDRVLFIEENGIYVRDEQGWLVPTINKHPDGLRVLGQILSSLREQIIIECAEQYSYIPTNCIPTLDSRWIEEVAGSLAGLSDAMGVQVIPQSETDKGRFVRMADCTWNLYTGQQASKSEVIEANMRYIGKSKACLLKTPSEAGNDKAKEVIAYYGERPLRYAMYLLRQGGKEAGVFKASTSDAGKTTLAVIFQQIFGMVGIVPNGMLKSSKSGSFDTLEGELVDNLLTFIEECDKAETINTARINQSLGSGRITLNRKYQPIQRAVRKSSLAMLTAGAIPVTWDAQGIVPNRNGKGGRIKGLVHLPNEVMPAEMGYFWNAAETAQQRQEAINALARWLLMTEWTQDDKAQALTNLRSFIDGTRSEWQQALIRHFERSEKGTSVEASAVKEVLDECDEKPSTAELQAFMQSYFSSSRKLQRIGQKVYRVWILVKQRNQDALSLET